mgnify:CR=1 FL=1
MIHKFSCTLCLIVLACFISSVTSAQELEIYIPEKSVDAPRKQETDNILARCLATGLEEYCAGISFNANGATLESNGVSEITLETFVIDLNDDGDVKKPKVTIKTDTETAVNTDKQTDIKSVKSAGIEIEFDFNSYKLRVDQLDKVSAVATALADKINDGKLYVIIGHTDGKGSDAYNCKLSKKRAVTLTTTLLLAGVKAELRPIGAGEALLKDPINPNDRKNRRVSFLKLDNEAEAAINAFQSLCD